MFALFLRVLWQFHATEGFVNWAFAKASGKILCELCDGSKLGTRGRGELFCIIRAKRRAGSFDELAPSLGVGRWGFLGVGTLCVATLCAGTQEGKTSPCGHDWHGLGGSEASCERSLGGRPRAALPPACFLSCLQKLLLLQGGRSVCHPLLCSRGLSQCLIQ